MNRISGTLTLWFSTFLKRLLKLLSYDQCKAVDFLEVWKEVSREWCEHKPSVTISVAEDEWLPVAAWVYDNFDILSGVSFLPFDPTEYPQAPYQTLTEEQYEEWTKKMPETIDWSRLN
jgi:ribonucleoside-triphosphate reductase